MSTCQLERTSSGHEYLDERAKTWLHPANRTRIHLLIKQITQRSDWISLFLPISLGDRVLPDKCHLILFTLIVFVLIHTITFLFCLCDLFLCAARFLKKRHVPAISYLHGISIPACIQSSLKRFAFLDQDPSFL